MYGKTLVYTHVAINGYIKTIMLTLWHDFTPHQHRHHHHNHHHHYHHHQQGVKNYFLKSRWGKIRIALQGNWTQEIHGPKYENSLFCPPLLCLKKKRSEKIISAIGSSMAINGGGATSECPHSRFLLQKTGTLLVKTLLLLKSRCQNTK